MREITQGLMLDLAVLAIRATQQVGLIYASLVDASRRGYMNCPRSSSHDYKITAYRTRIKTIRVFLVATKCILLKCVAPCVEWTYADNRLKIRGKFG